MLVNRSSYDNMQLKGTGFFVMWTKQRLRKYLSIHNLFVMSILVQIKSTDTLFLVNV